MRFGTFHLIGAPEMQPGEQRIAETIEQMVLAEANEHIAAGRYDDAYPSLRYLETKQPQTAGLKDAIENYLWVQIGGAYKAASSLPRPMTVRLSQRFLIKVPLV